MPRTHGVSIEPATRRYAAEYATILAMVNPAAPLSVIVRPLNFPPGLLTHGGNLCLIARVGDRIVGALLAGPPRWALTHRLSLDLQPAVLGVSVAPAYRGRGIASALARDAEQRCSRAGLRLLTLEHSPAATGFYTRHGYTAGQEELIVALPGELMVRQWPGLLFAAKPLVAGMSVTEVPGAPARVVTGLLPGCHISADTRYDQLKTWNPDDGR